MSLLHGAGSLVLGYVLALAGVVVGLVRRRAPWSRYLGAPLNALVALAAAAGLGGVLLALIERTSGHSLPLAIRVGSLGAMLVTSGLLVGVLRSRDTNADMRKRGAEVLEVPGWLRSQSRSDGTLTIAGVPIPYEDETKHFKIFGTTGAGKTTAITELVGGAIARGDRAVFADPDGGYLAKFYDPDRGDVILNPFDSRSRKWDLFRELRSPYDYDQLARSLVGEGAGDEKSWRRYAQTFLSALVQQTHALGTCNSAEFYRLLNVAEEEELRALLACTPAQPLLATANEKMFSSVRSIAMSATTALDFIVAQEAEAFSIREWVEKGKGLLFLPYQADQIATLRSVISTWMRIAIFQAMSQGEGDQRIWFTVDELDALGAIDGLKDALARLRKFGGRCALGFQSIAQVSGTYGKADAQTIVENCSNSVILRCSASEGGGTAHFASRLIGDREIVRYNVTRTQTTAFFQQPKRAVSRSVQHVVEPAVLPSEIEQLPDLTGYLKLASKPTWLIITLPR